MSDTAEKKAPPTVEMGAGGQIPAPEKPVSEMDDVEKAALKEKVAESLREQVASGDKNTFTIVIDDPKYPGTIIMRRPNMDEQREIGLRAAKYLQGVAGVDLRTDNIALFFATFDILVDWNAAPDWFKPRKMFDYRVLEHIYGRWTKWVQNFPEFVSRPQESDSADKDGKA